jgi:hypothetical protein
MNNRETATLIWLGIALAVLLMKADLRSALWDFVKLSVRPSILGLVAALAAWTFGLVALADAVGLWEDDLRNETIVWLITVGIALLFSLRRVAEDGFFRRTVRRAVSVTVFVEVFVNLAVFSLPVELLLLPALSFVTMLAAVSERQAEHAPVHRLANAVLAMAGLGFAVYVAVRLAGDFDAESIGRAFLLPVWLTLGAIPVAYLVGLWSAYRHAFIRIRCAADDPAGARRAKWALLRAAHVRAAEVGGFAGHWIRDLATAESRGAARTVAKRWRKAWRAERRADRLIDARASMRLWLAEDNPTLAEIHRDALRRIWDGLDPEQRETLEAEDFVSLADDASATL